MKAWWRGIKQNKEGSSMVSVVIAVVFLVTIGIVILTVATRYTVAVLVDRNSTDNFYAAEGILEEVRTGLVEYAAASSESAYIETLEKYSATTEADASKAGTPMVSSMQSQFSERYIRNLGGKLLTHFEWKVGVLQRDDAMIDRLKSLTNVPEAVMEVAGKTGVMINRDDRGRYYLTVKDILVDYVDESDYRSTIQTDISIGIPDYKFQGDSTLNEIKNYLSISDGSMEVGEGTSADGSEFTGNIYAGEGEDNRGIFVNSDVLFHCNTIITRKNLELRTGAHVTMEGENGIPGDLWAQNILIAKSGDGGSETDHTIFDMNENAYISNDLSISDNNSEVTLKGKYYGYSYNEKNDPAVSGLQGEYSSAVLINGLNTSLDGSGLAKLILAGRAFVSSENEAGESRVGSSNIQTGESVAVKSDQLAYLVPDRYILIDGSAADGHNPVSRSENWAIDETGLKNEYGAYLASTPYKANYNNASGYVFFFLNFASDAKANEFFQKYYSGSYMDEDGNEISQREELKERALPYLASTGTDLEIKVSGNLNLLAGNIVKNYDATGEAGIQAANYYEDSGKPAGILLTDGQKTGLTYVNKQLYLTSAGDATQMRLSLEPVLKDKKLVEDTLIDFSKVSGEVTLPADLESGGRIYAVDGSYVVNSASISKGILIARGDVEVQRDFEGLIIAGGKVKVTRADVEMKANISMVSSLLEKVRTDPVWSEKFKEIFRGLSGAKEQQTTDIESCFRYENWTKNNG